MKKFIITTNYSQAEQAFIQGGHASDELATAVGIGVLKGTEMADVYWRWATEHKTYVSLNVPDPEDLENLYDWFIENQELLKVPAATFQEPRLKNTTTGLSFIGNEKLSANIQFFVSNFLAHLKTKYDIVEFMEMLTLEKEDEVFTDSFNRDTISFSLNDNVVTVTINEEEPIDYNWAELDFFMKVRFLPLK